jgi:hypothetical protein
MLSQKQHNARSREARGSRFWPRKLNARRIACARSTRISASADAKESHRCVPNGRPLSFFFASQIPVESHLIISNRSVPRLETHLTPFAATPLPVLIDTNSATKYTTSSPPAPKISSADRGAKLRLIWSAEMTGTAAARRRLSLSGRVRLVGSWGQARLVCVG